jgi:histidinol-phosphate/aromatic aminotransferase/cobyric acid decarboxylase-like protein
MKEFCKTSWPLRLSLELLQIKAILDLPVLVVLDEAYIEFSNVPSKLRWVQQYNNLVVLRTFSKSAGEGHGFI